ncbi:hypothetical protein ACWGHM_00970 [Streptomyces sp. NPDC054904]|uniref:hypothetical protein n=1 Tax=Streptomyces sp. NPDC090054 TaxID=3365933 RepID=UPI0038204054
MFAVSAEETIDLARAHGLDVVHHTGREDPHGRPGVTWTHLGFRRGPRTGPPSGPRSGLALP